MIRIETSRTGLPVPLMNEKALVSRFDPQKEASRFIENKIGSPPGILLILGDVFGYLRAAAGKLLPGTEVYSITVSEELASNDTDYGEECLFNRGKTREFLDRVLREDNFSGLTVLEWQPVLKMFPDFSAAVTRLIQRRLQILNGNITTVRGFGNRWLKNTILNFLYIPRFSTLACGNSGIALIAASGASLKNSCSLLSDSRLPVIALPSSLRFMKSIGRLPVLTVQTDPGYYAVYHLREGTGWLTHIASPLSACPYIARTKASILPLNQGDPFEQELFRQLEIPAYFLPSAGTVAATAMSAAIALGADPAVMAGLDLCYDDINTHVSPHSFDEVFSNGSSRNRPLYSVKYRYSRDTRSSEGQSRALETYSKWFTELDRDFSEKVKRIKPSRIKLPMEVVTADDVSAFSGNSLNIKFDSNPAPDFKVRKRIILNILEETHGHIKQGTESSMAEEFIEKTGNVETGAQLIGELLNRVRKMEHQ